MLGDWFLISTLIIRPKSTLCFYIAEIHCVCMVLEVDPKKIDFGSLKLYPTDFYPKSIKLSESIKFTLKNIGTCAGEISLEIAGRSKSSKHFYILYPSNLKSELVINPGEVINLQVQARTLESIGIQRAKIKITGNFLGKTVYETINIKCDIKKAFHGLK